MSDYQKEYEEKINLQKKVLEIENIAKNHMSQEAITRYGALKSAHPQKALHAIAVIAQLASQGEIKDKVTDEQFKKLLMSIEPEKKETKIIRK